MNKKQIIFSIFLILFTVFLVYYLNHIYINKKNEDLYQQFVNEQIQFKKDNSTYTNALINNNLSSCNEIKMDFMKNICLRQLTKNIKTQNSVLKDNIELCNEIDNEEDKTYCFDNYYYVKYVNTNDTSFCNYIEEDYFKEKCTQ